MPPDEAAQSGEATTHDMCFLHRLQADAHWLAIELTLHGRATGPGGGAFERTVLGGGGEPFGLILYDSPGGHERFLDLVDSRSPAAAAQVDSLACLIDFDDDFVVRAMTAAFGVEASRVVGEGHVDVGETTRLALNFRRLSRRR